MIQRHAQHTYGQVSTLVRKRSTHDVTKASAQNRLATKASIGSEWSGNDKQVMARSQAYQIHKNTEDDLYIRMYVCKFKEIAQLVHNFVNIH